MADTIAARIAAGKVLRIGDEGDAVWELELRLSRPPTGYFTASLSDWVKAFQSQNGLTADGIVGQQTASKLPPVPPPVVVTPPAPVEPAPSPVEPTPPADAAVLALAARVAQLEDTVAQLGGRFEALSLRFAQHAHPVDVHILAPELADVTP